jgi:amino acid adenylation domain-containing protein
MALLHEFLGAHASARADQPAVVFKDRTLTYAELDRLSSKLCAQLLASGVQRGDRVGFSLTKSPEAIVSIFGILKAGAVYVPIDPGMPAPRARFIVRNCRMRCLITSAVRLEELAESAGDAYWPDKVILVGAPVTAPFTPPTRTETWLSDVHAATDASNPGTIDADLAYILYTSGSTGDPKGVMLTHRHAINFVDWACEAFAITSSDRLSNHAPLHFDLSILDVFCALKSGATLVLVPDGLSIFPTRLAEFIEQQKITIWYSVPSALMLMVLHGQLERFSFESLRTVLFAGEVFPVKYLRAVMKLLPRATFFNLYGPTETNVCTYYRVPELPEDRTAPIPIGIACANTEVFGLDENGRRISRPGEEGELCARGVALTVGYWNDHERTNRVLVPNPLQPDFRELMYRTGDIVTLDDEGNFILIGRRDHMIKSRGYRIELGEIESVLMSHPKVREAVAVPIPHDVFGALIRVAIVGDDAALPTTQEIEQHCSERLPHYMIPESVAFVNELPKTSTGKIDRKALVGQLATSPERQPD